MYFVEKLKAHLTETAEQMQKGLARIDSPEFDAEMRAKYPEGSIYPCKYGALKAQFERTVNDISGMGLWYISEIEPEIALMERLAAVCDALGIDPDNLAELETLAKDNRYRMERNELRDRIQDAAGEVRDDAREREHDNCCAMLEAAGFVHVERDDFEGWERVNPGITERIQIESKHRPRSSDYWYEFTYERDGVEQLSGKSGEFDELLDTVGISQDVEVKS